MAKHTPYDDGFRDAFELVSDSGVGSPGADGWDGLLINALGSNCHRKLWPTVSKSRAWDRYLRGAEAGARAALAGADAQPVAELAEI